MMQNSTESYCEKYPDVTIITVCKNAGEDLVDTCKSVLSQEGVNIQFVLQDGVSTDNTVTYLNNLKDSRIDLLSEPDSGIYDAMNRAIERVKGKWCIYINAGDCFYSSESLMRILSEAEAEADTELFVFGCYNEYDKTVTITPRKVSSYFLYRNGIYHQAQLWRVEVLRQYLPFDTSYQVTADHNLLVRAFFSGIKIKSSKTIGVSYKDGGFSAMPSMQSIINTERSRTLNTYLTPYKRYLYSIFEVIFLKSLRMHFIRNLRGTIMFRFYKLFINYINHVFG